MAPGGLDDQPPSPSPSPPPPPPLPPQPPQQEQMVVRCAPDFPTSLNPTLLTKALSQEASHETEGDTPDLTLLPKSCTCLQTRSGTPVYLVGTAHVSHNSVEDAQRVIRLIHPDVVVVELCRRRVRMLFDDYHGVATTEMTLKGILNILKQQGGTVGLFYVIYAWFLQKVGKDLKITPGAEFRAAAIEAARCGANIVLGDRDVMITLKRAWHALSLWEKVKFCYFLLTGGDVSEEDIEKLKNTDLLTEMIQELGEHLPSLVHPLITERDQYLVASLQAVPPCRAIVGIVGMGHVQGMCKHWDLPIDRTRLNELRHSQSTSLLRPGRIATVAGIFAVTVGWLWWRHRFVFL